MIESDIQRRDRIVGKKLEHICRIRVNRKGSEVLKTKQNKEIDSRASGRK